MKKYFNKTTVGSVVIGTMLAGAIIWALKMYGGEAGNKVAEVTGN